MKVHILDFYLFDDVPLEFKDGGLEVRVVPGPDIWNRPLTPRGIQSVINSCIEGAKSYRSLTPALQQGEIE